jgi:thiol-disulfide isomerase/thioredoxin
MRAPVDHIAAPEFPGRLPWFNTEGLRMADQLGHPVLIEFWDFCRPNSLRTLPYLQAWHERYADAGLRVIGVHASGFPPSSEPGAVGRAVERLDIAYPIVVDIEHAIWEDYGNLGWPGRYLFDQRGMLFEQHYGEGAYDETERSIQELLGLEAALVEPKRPEDVPGARLEPQSEDVEGPYSGPYRAGGVWAVLDGQGWIEAGGRRIDVDHAGAYELISHPQSTEGVLHLRVGPGVDCYAVCFTPGVDPAAT